MFGLDLGHLSTGEVEHLLAEQLEDDHVVLAKALAGAARPDNVANERGPVLGPFLLQDLSRKEGQTDSVLVVHCRAGRLAGRQTHQSV